MTSNKEFERIFAEHMEGRGKRFWRVRRVASRIASRIRTELVWLGNEWQESRRAFFDYREDRK